VPIAPVLFRSPRPDLVAAVTLASAIFSKVLTRAGAGSFSHFLPHHFMVSDLTVKSLLHLGLISNTGRETGPASSSARGRPVASTPFVEKTVVFPSRDLDTREKMSWPWAGGFTSGLSVASWGFFCQCHAVLSVWGVV
jgi:hypothetical protein